MKSNVCLNHNSFVHDRELVYYKQCSRKYTSMVCCQMFPPPVLESSLQVTHLLYVKYSYFPA